jgi:Mce-associated membrane protein
MTSLTRGKHSAANDTAANDTGAKADGKYTAAKNDGKDDMDTADVPAAPESTSRAFARRRGGRPPKVAIGTQILVLLVLVTLALAVAIGFLMQRQDELNDTAAGAQRAMHAAATAAQDLSSYDYRTLESDIKTAANQTTGKLKTDYQRQAQQIVATARQQQAVVNGQTVKSGVVSATSKKVEVLVFLNQSTSKAAVQDGQQRTPNQLRLLMTMERADGRWLVSRVDVL